jgi:AraC-like DNA-binding protein
MLGYALLTSATLREAIEIGIRYASIRQRSIGVRFAEDCGEALIELRELHPIGPARHFFFEGMLVGLARGLAPLLGMHNLPMALCFDHPQPTHFERYSARLPPTRFSQGAAQVRFPGHCLDLPPVMSDRPTSQHAAEQCERELAALGPSEGSEDLVARVCGALSQNLERLPSLDSVAEGLCISGRTLKRKLQAQGTSFQSLVDEVRQRQALALLGHDGLTVQDIATTLGYLDPANFTRAFRRWSGCTPSDYRVSLQASIRQDDKVMRPFPGA